MDDWQPVRVAPPTNDFGHIHEETIEFMRRYQGRIIRVRPMGGIPTSCSGMTLEVHPDDQVLMEDFQKAGPWHYMCEHQIIAD